MGAGARCFVGLSTCPNPLRDFGAPPLEHFWLIWENVRHGGMHVVASSASGGAYRVQKVAWCLYEVLRESEAAFLL